MKFPFGKKKDRSVPTASRPLQGRQRWNRDQVILMSIGALILLLTAVVVWDALLFYTTVVIPRPRAEYEPPPATVNTEEIDTVIQLLDARASAFDTVLKGK